MKDFKMQPFEPIQYNNALDTTATADFKSASFWHAHIKENHQDPHEIGICIGLIINSGLFLSDRHDINDSDLLKAHDLICLGLGLADFIKCNVPQDILGIIRAKIDRNMPEFII